MRCPVLLCVLGRGFVRVWCLLREWISGRDSGFRRPAADPTDGGSRAMPNDFTCLGTPGVPGCASTATMSRRSDHLRCCGGMRTANALTQDVGDVPSSVARDGVSRAWRADTRGSAARGVPLRVERTGRSGRSSVISRGRGRHRPYATVSPNVWRGVGHARRQHISDAARHTGAARRLGAHLLGARGVCASRRDAVDHRAANGAAAIAASPSSARPAA